MAYVKMPKDLSKIKPKIALNMDKRQLIIAGIAAAIVAPIFFTLNSFLSVQQAGIIAFILLCPFFIAAKKQWSGLPLEKLLWYAYNIHFRRIKQRPYIPQGHYSTLVEQQELYEEIEKIGGKSDG